MERVNNKVLRNVLSDHMLAEAGDRRGKLLDSNENRKNLIRLYDLYCKGELVQSGNYTKAIPSPYWEVISAPETK